ncbi:MAG TPA: HDOD domain-containing protein [Pseudomonas sp.]|nr:HDOD domain-containing protein [Pseudomonas sp.]
MPMPDPSTPPRSLNGWLERLDGVNLPLSRRQREQLCHELRHGERPLRVIAPRLQTSPAVTLALLREANRQSPGPLGGAVEHVEGALVRLGLERAEAILRDLPERSAATLPPSLIQLLVISQHAQHQAAGLFASRMARLENEIHCASLLFLAPLWALAQAYPDLPLRWAARVLGERQPAQLVERDLLGVSLPELCLALARRWRLPEGVTFSYQLLHRERDNLIRCMRLARRPGARPLQRLQDEDPELLRWLTRPANSALLANALALTAHFSWDDARALRWQRLSALYLEQPLDRLQARLHSLAADSARLLPNGPAWHPAQALLWPAGSRRPPAPEPPSLLSSFFRPEEWRRLCDRFTQQPSAFANLPHLLASAAQALALCGLQRFVLMFSDRQGQLIALHQQGLAPRTPRLKADPGHWPLLPQLVAQPVLVHVSPQRNPGLGQRLPPAIREQFDDRHLVMRGFNLGGRNSLVLIGDQHGMPFSDRQLELLEKTARVIERGTLAFGKRPADTATPDGAPAN